ncbi:chromosome replication/partitioning protein [Borrelia sp. RT1S]|uniref:chromosome replication/partitioning protein n=1 Tax=Borrelia sp. RT1S TaxID=2898580 RepID=UPI001E5AA74F|nr:chromosome replication/partitioning protein [Borrelia sp. RT1S]UGQ17901.1 chromosome replication/partitioning protein [Borrelia sp. RT1S]
MAKLVPNISSRIKNRELQNENEIREKRYLELVGKLRALVAKDIRTKIEMAKTVLEIYDDKLYIAGGFDSFASFIKTCGLSNTTVYSYVRIGKAIKEGHITEQDIIDRGINYIRVIVEKSNYGKLKEERALTKSIPLRILIPSENTYSYFKQNTKFTSYALSKLYEEHRELLDNLFFRYSQEKKHKKVHDAEDAIEMEAIEDTGQKDNKQIEE